MFVVVYLNFLKKNLEKLYFQKMIGHFISMDHWLLSYKQEEMRGIC